MWSKEFLISPISFHFATVLKIWFILSQPHVLLSLTLNYVLWASFQNVVLFIWWFHVLMFTLQKDSYRNTTSNRNIFTSALSRVPTFLSYTLTFKALCYQNSRKIIFFLLNSFHEIEDCFMQLLVEECLEN